MRPLAFCLAVSLFAAVPEFREVKPGYRYQFPRDHFDHPEFRTEWWYYTGNVRAADGRRYGFELVFFRQGEHRGPADNPSAWRADDVYLAHLALTDIDGGHFHYYQRLNRAGPGIAGVRAEEGRIWNGNWETNWDLASGAQTLRAVAEGIRFQLRLTPRTPPVIHGEDGISRKAAGEGKASYYVSFPLLAVNGTLNGASVTGTAWMDHEWFTHQLDPDQRGWDWFSIQLENGTELMLFQLRRTDGSIDPFSSGTYIAPRRPRGPSEALGLHAPAARNLGQRQHRGALSRAMADSGALAGGKSGVPRCARRSGTIRGEQLLGGCGRIQRVGPWSGVPGNDRLRQTSAAIIRPWNSPREN